MDVLSPYIIQGSSSFKAALYTSPIGKMIILSNDTHLFLVEFVGRKDLDKEINALYKKYNCGISICSSPPIVSICNELDLYFKGKLKSFSTPIILPGTPFQQKVWKELLNIPFGETKSYLAQATAMNNAKGVRAVANANGKNQFAIIIPCHRVVQKNGSIGGYGGGIEKKKWLLEHELKY